MEQFNYISVGVSIVLAISVTHLLTGLRDVVAPGRRDWLVVCWFGYLGYLHLLTWWSLFATHQVATWSLGAFAIVMAVPGFLYLTLYTLIPENPAAVHSWREHFEKVRRWFFTFYALFITASALRESALMGRSLLGVGNALDAISIVNVTVGAIWRNRQIQIAVLLVELAIACFVSAQRFYAQH